MAFHTVDLGAHIGTKILSDIPTLLSGKHASEIRQLLANRVVLVFPQLGMTDDEQIAFTKTLGTFKIEDSSNGEIFKISLDPKETGRAYSLRASFYWHIDGTSSDVPLLASILSPRCLPAEGGDTQFCNTYAAYQELPKEDKALIAGLRVNHSPAVSARLLNPDMDYEHYCFLRTLAKDLPLVWLHRDGRKSLILGSTTEYVVGWGPEESRDLLVRLQDWATRPRFVYQHKWSMGDLVIWDNTGAMHRAVHYEADSGRLMHRTQLEGEEAFLNHIVEPA